ncbi:MAG: winged helix DNA-binding domain-containing protein, partial [Actinomycetota bacterium]|nr:winged helix DNA-binding domain-containing protein [Actinomycetota bacterium]
SDLLGLQAQVPGDPYVGLWSRLADFNPASLSELMQARAVLRMVVIRGTIHLVTADDAVALRPYAQAVLEQELRSHGGHKDHLKGVDLDQVIAYAEPFLTASPRSPTELRALLAEEFPHLNSSALALACRNRLPLVQTPPRGLWQSTGGLRLMTLEGWIGRDCAGISARQSREIVLRYLAAFGPALASDIVTWSRVPSLGRTMEDMASQLRRYTNERSQQLFDLPDAQLINADVDSSPRFLPEYDNLLLSHKDRSRFGDDDRRRQLGQASAIKGTVLIDGFISAAWHISRDIDTKPSKQAAATLHVECLEKVNAATGSAVEAEGLALVRLLTPSAMHHRVKVSRIDR